MVKDNEFLNLLGDNYQRDCTCGERGRPEERHATSCPVSPWPGIWALNAEEAEHISKAAPKRGRKTVR